MHIKDGWITAFNGTLGIGHKIDNDLHVCPQIKLTIEAIAKCGQNIAITQLDNNRLSIKSDKFRAIIPCIATNLLAPTIPDPPIADIDNRLKEAFEICGLLHIESGQTIYALSVLMNGQSLVSSLSGSMIVEYWHGLNLPIGLAIPKAFIGPLLKVNKKVNRFGFSQFSITIYFEDDSWIKSQLYSNEWPSVAHILDKKSDAQKFPLKFFDGLEAIAPFSEGLVYFHKNLLCSHADANIGASFEIEELMEGPVVSIRQLMILKSFVNFIDFKADDGKMIMFFGKNARGAIAAFKNV